ncbi:TIGR03087 family PEP-CTERM/XrtA system glycosyltransferase [Rhodoferax sp.]|uniref:TIGR03087 family PEP-CTERM/XrtA system glycosyltransferase n=1 Tax=Rhodoferax sp. TaxID=50421 RepID=UPI00283FE834|nr:TIGR03087 family PEP-CTERM/XrtA system glycosyltransferase [Rhodoferax sp.]MDR3369909.1 TIGR03087 family PEP-CTERM/XrtA system glycosyltransferase [Rhodoferax sp.]
MGKLLYLVHRLPYPPNKGDKVRSYHLLKHLTQQHRVFLGTFIDDPADEAYLDTVRTLCPDLHVARLHPRSAKIRSLTGLLTHQALGLRYYQNAGLQAWVRQTLAQHQIDAVVIFSSVMAQYVDTRSSPPMLVDFVDVDSAKWTQYAPEHRWPLSWLYRREGERLLAFERSVAQRAQRSFFVTENEAELFRGLAPETAHLVDTISNGVDADFFAPDPARPSPFGSTEDHATHIPLVFTGAMDYWPNVDAVTWFVANILPTLRQQWPQLCFYIVGRSPPPAVQALTGSGVVVTGTVPDVRPYLQHAAVVVAPLRVARGIQNKILEAMAMARPVVASDSCAQAITAKPETELLSATSPANFVMQINALLSSPQRCASVGAAGRARVLSDYSWSAHLSKINAHLNPKAHP